MAEQAANTTPRSGTATRGGRQQRGGRRDERRSDAPEAPREFEEVVVNIDRVARRNHRRHKEKDNPNANLPLANKRNMNRAVTEFCVKKPAQRYAHKRN